MVDVLNFNTHSKSSKQEVETENRQLDQMSPFHKYTEMNERDSLSLNAVADLAAVKS